MGTHVETLPARGTSRRTWAIVGVVVLLLAALGAGVLIGRATETTAAPKAAPVEGLATPQVVEMLDGTIAAWNAGDAGGAASYYSQVGVFHDLIAGETSNGTEEIGAKMARYGPGAWGIERVSEVVQQGEFAGYAFTYDGGYGITVFELDNDNKILQQWAMGV